MLAGRVYRIFLRYAAMNVALDRRGGALPNADGRPICTVKGMSLRANRQIIEGRAEGATVTLTLGPVTHDADIDPSTGRFVFDLPSDTGPVTIKVDGSGPLVLRGFSRAELALARAALLPRFVASLVALAPDIYRWKMRGDLGGREVVKERLGLVPRSDAGLLNSALLDPQPALPPDPSATLIMPVFNAFPLLEDSLARVLRHSGDQWRLILIEDASTDPRVRPFLRAWAEGKPVTLLENDRNLGFIGSVNRGLALARERWPDAPVVLLNSDALVPDGWLPRLLAPLSDPDTASVTPMSNDAEIFSVPAICTRISLSPGEADALDRIAARFNPDAGIVSAPTGVGFCMALSPKFLAHVPEFDTGFGRGYGEENDWCQKVRVFGGQHRAAPNLFVEHHGGQSFPSAEKQRLLEQNLRRLSRRHPGYEAAVQDFIRRDPLHTVRLALGLALTGNRQKIAIPVYIGHALGGGADNWLDTQIKGHLSEGVSAVVLRVWRQTPWKLELHCPEGLAEGLCDDEAFLETLLDLLPKRHIIYSCGVGARDPLGLPSFLLKLAGRTGDRQRQPLRLLLHDYFAISPSYTLLCADGVYRGVPRAGFPQASDPAHQLRLPNQKVDLREWQTAWGALLKEADDVVAFSNASADILHEAYPERSDIRICPHDRPVVPPLQSPAPRDATVPTVGVLGNIGEQKGAALVARLSRALLGKARIIVIGDLAPEYRLASPGVVHGSYRLEDLPGLITRYGIRVWLMPSIWPETYSFTTHEMLGTGLPVIAFGMGAQGEAVGAAMAHGAPGSVLPFGEPDELFERMLAAIEKELAVTSGKG
ncbi:Glycosyltransferase, GT2 family [Poseidonocella pacifica]|uniref:Glycosyltransferase, GT2 family n=1 Tax=Poseidonocella pacifica TaxID=871651 RepID=A0A1I0XT80_9RHOB|nr:glycosyltransferase [Poseidonocella pacifica]SFB04212.1 Glycosyltransferase, GT2 family [Poseidonocella pacifica]